MTEYNGLTPFLPQDGNWPHTVLLESDGAEALRFAREAAAALLCGKAGCACDTCRRVREGIHPDVQLLDRETRDITVEDVRAMRRDAVVAPLESGRKVYIILHAQNMNGVAQNAALKLLEEPPEGVYFMLLCDNALSLLQTVRSRCVVIGGAAGGGEESTVDAESQALAGEFAAALAQQSELALLEFCLKNEKLKRAQLDGFFTAALDLLEQALRASAGADVPGDAGAEKLAGLPPAALVRLAGMLARRKALNEGNVGPAHLLGTIPAEFFAGDSNLG